MHDKLLTVFCTLFVISPEVREEGWGQWGGALDLSEGQCRSVSVIKSKNMTHVTVSGTGKQSEKVDGEHETQKKT